MGMERLLLVLEAAEAADPSGLAARLTAVSPPDLYLVNRGPLAEARALWLARQLRGAGLSVELDGTGSAFGKQFKRADRCGAAWAAVIGDEEAATGHFSLKQLDADGEERRLSLDDWPNVVDMLQSGKVIS